MDLATLALSITRDQFRSRFQCQFLCADLSVGRTTRPQRTEAFSAEESTAAQVGPPPGPPFVAPLVKVQELLVEVADAGSRNGTFVAGAKLEPKQLSRLQPGDRVRFARLPFQLLDASRCWDWLVHIMDQWG
ncbi:MAG: hypothetical protein JWM53_2581 [bacterium]|nr:hypothetical protein [bacterium]